MPAWLGKGFNEDTMNTKVESKGDRNVFLDVSGRKKHLRVSTTCFRQSSLRNPRFALTIGRAARVEERTIASERDCASPAHTKFASPAHTGFASAAHTSITFFFKHPMLPQTQPRTQDSPHLQTHKLSHDLFAHCFHSTTSHRCSAFD